MFTYLRKLIPSPATPQLVNEETKETVVEYHSHRRSSIFRKPCDMTLEISEVVSHAVDIVLLTFVLVWSERQNERKRALTVYPTDRYQ